jgi:hypothetical protein
MRASALISLLVVLDGLPRPCAGFAVLAHQAVVDAAWETAVVPALHRRFPEATAEQLENARAFAYGGSHIADLGYFPLGNRLFTDLVHYVRSGDFIAALLDGAETVDEYAFALGALAHWVTDSTGHPEATNRAVALLYPELRDEHGDSVAYADAQSAHMTTEFRFDVLQIAHSKGSPDRYSHSAGFQVSERLLDEAFRRTYGLALDDLFTSTETAIVTYRFAFRTLIHEVTGAAWELYRADVEELDATATRATFVADVSRSGLEEEFGKTYREPGYFAKFFALLVKLIPDIGPLRRMAYKPLPSDVQKLFTDALAQTIARYTDAVRQPRSRLENLVLDTGRPTRRGDYAPADEAYVALLERLDERDFAAPRATREDLRRFFSDPAGGSTTTGCDPDSVRSALKRLNEIPETPH